KKIIAGAALAGSLMLTGLVGFAQQQQATRGQGDQERGEHQGRGDKEGRGMHGGFGGRFAEKLNLTDAQKEQMKQIAARYHESAKANRQQGRGERRGGDSDLFNGGTFNEAAVRAAAQARASERVEMEVARAHMMFEMYNVLTPEQKAQLAADRQQREQKRQEWRARRGTNSGQDK
ncbi:MAG TPA: Spy/CpxP family protein refolding chaperone, partial [Pyrinomonadaceae bacterium]|nr:Spy/CpxP family protein refolding chaperone [Pyrinomonadaceae bacterium]